VEAPTLRAGATSLEDHAMSEEQDLEHEKRSMRLMWIFSAAIVLLILGGMGLDMYFHPDAGKSPTDISSQSKQ
jgi:hypothetical protein